VSQSGNPVVVRIAADLPVSVRIAVSVAIAVSVGIVGPAPGPADTRYRIFA
jgi:hypothetical protein